MEAESAATRKGLTRRAFVGGVAGFAGVFAVGGVGVAVAGQSLLRPPGGQDEAVLLGACIRCGRCESICPHDAIDIATVEDGLVNARTPKLNFRHGYCDFCEGEYRCANVCPTDALRPFDEHADALGIAVIDTDNCLLWRSSSCTKKCVDVCRYDALSLDGDGRVVIDGTACNGCGACEFVCPSASYSTFTGSARRGINIELLEEGRGA